MMCLGQLHEILIRYPDGDVVRAIGSVWQPSPMPDDNISSFDYASDDELDSVIAVAGPVGPVPTKSATDKRVTRSPIIRGEWCLPLSL